MSKKLNLMYIMQLPPPIHGVTKINDSVYNSEEINSIVNNKELINLKFSEELTSVNQWSLKKIIRYFKVLWQIIKKASSKKIDYAYFTMNSVGKAFFRDLIIVYILKFFRKKIILHLHGRGVDEKSKSFVMKLLYNRVFSNTNLIFVADRVAKNEMHNISPKNCKVFSAMNGIQTFCGKPKPKDINNNKIKILFLSALMPNKGILVLLRAINKLKETHNNFQLDVVGGHLVKSDLEKINNYIAENSLQNYVNMHGPIYDDTKYDFLSQADIFVHPTLNESFGLVILEAMQFAKPIIASYEGGIPNILENNKTGMLVEKGNSNELLQKIIYLIENPEIRKRLGIAAKKVFFDKFTNKHFEKRMIDVFSALN